MKIIHTADWHLGRILNGKSLLEDQAYILDEFVAAMQKEKPDVIVIAGDVYDTSYPSKAAIMLFEETINQLNLHMQIPMIVTNGNHDGKERLNYGAKWFEKSQMYIRTELATMATPINIGNVNFYCLPFATISEVQAFFDDKTITTHQAATQSCITYMAENLDTSQFNVLVGHMTVQGGTRSDSERPISIGTVESVEQDVFAPFNYVMLGHLHHPFSINSEFIYYSGSLLQYSFSEVNQPKGYRMLLIDEMEQQQLFIPLEPKRQLEVVEGDYEAAIQENIPLKNKENYIHFKLKNMTHVTDPMMHLKQIYPNTLSLTNVSFNFETASVENNTELRELNDSEIINNFYQSMTDSTLSELQHKKIVQLLNDLLEGEE
ncbi:exonuclease subunit SbcD [Staphylococcus arlettae]|uniref:exonuclease subunit SbcD n=1 Tax=Staphylococcus TaxID=1279 RepID=UPI001138FA37|nr:MULTISPECIES: exonuclease subunit SbcD [Staphylococcus]KAB2479953.1 exonuclease SbcCD subunit D [Staphylococcus sp. CH99b_3]MCD8838023.1 exonuclease SbcCD subunit D [Staphylococcus arlettae]MCD8865804.1 exonuclease SbcCD subunit D [Staphylococcus arlettae]MCD9054370.1 exonuclease SbcCD subunit D [Staphylococcus arlettae]MCP8715574.1 exonuclease SbcCD subunit D [Staphylococcus arlettae]